MSCSFFFITNLRIIELRFRIGGILFFSIFRYSDIKKSQNMSQGKLIIFSAPSGSGKTTLVRHLLAQGLDLVFSVSCTSRPPRGTEQDGVDYYFISPEEFRQRIENDEFLEYEEVYTDKFYGTLKSEVERLSDEGHTVVFDVDVKGGVNIKKY